VPLAGFRTASGSDTGWRWARRPARIRRRRLTHRTLDFRRTALVMCATSPIKAALRSPPEDTGVRGYPLALVSQLWACAGRILCGGTFGPGLDTNRSRPYGYASDFEPSLTVHTVEARLGARLVRVAYDLSCAPTDAAQGRILVERVAVHAVDEHDGPVEPTRSPIVILHQTVILSVGTERRVLETNVQRTDLDVEQDWWSTDQSGQSIPIAEWVDHIVADISLHEMGEALEQTTTAVVTGSWGALGPD
jgi:hypothetical protein